MGHIGAGLTNPTSSKRLGKIQIAFGIASLVMHHRINRIIAITMNSPTMQSAATERYHTPMRSFVGHSGNITPASMTATIAIPPTMFQNGLPS